MPDKSRSVLVVGSKSDSYRARLLQLLHLAGSPKRCRLLGPCFGARNDKITLPPKGQFQYAIIADDHAGFRGREISGVWLNEAANLPHVRECVNLDPTTYFDFDRPTNRHQRRKDAAEARRSARRR